MSKQILVPIAWTSTQAGTALTLASTGWLVSGMSPSPLVNGMVPALLALPTLLPLPRRTAAGVALQFCAAILLLLVSLRVTGSSVVWPLLAVLLFGLGGRIGSQPLQQRLVERSLLPLGQLRLGSSCGQMLGTLLTGVLFPLGKAALQYSQALVLLLPLVPLAQRVSPAAEDACKPSAEPRSEGIAMPLSGACVIQGVLFGSLFGLLALWVRRVGAGNCFDFGMVLAAYGLGRTLATTALRPQLATGLPYGLIALLLAITQFPGIPGWGAVGLFLPMGLVGALSDEQRVAALGPKGGGPLGWMILERSGALGSLLGSLGIGLLSQRIGLPGALPLEVAGFLVAAVLLGSLRPRAQAQG